MEVAAQAGQAFETTSHVGRLGFDFLHANTIGSGGLKPGLKPLAGGGTDAIEVEAA